MKRLELDEAWPDSWKFSYPFDLMEIWEEKTHLGYYYAYKTRRDNAIKLLTEVTPEGGTVLDVAGAQGNFSLLLAELGYRVTWNDIRSDLVDYVKLKYETGHIDFAIGNVFDLGFHEQFDCVLITEIIEHVAHPDDFLKKLLPMVKPGGYIVMSTPNGAYFKNTLPRFSECNDFSSFEAVQFGPNSEDHIFLLWPDEIEKLANDAGVILDSHKVITSFLTNGHVKTRFLLRVIPSKLIMRLDQLMAFLPDTFKQKIMTSSVTRFKIKK
ncbi:MAG: methyltransferase domain-containing protein [Methylovulum miyakonense]|uniref:class I SAM-dependent methyltransferase n=1 Tax=Methylovulum miyakonense TaxID=645578 RepID=UPI003BB507F3